MGQKTDAHIVWHKLGSVAFQNHLPLPEPTSRPLGDIRPIPQVPLLLTVWMILGVKGLALCDWWAMANYRLRLRGLRRHQYRRCKHWPPLGLWIPVVCGRRQAPDQQLLPTTVTLWRLGMLQELKKKSWRFLKDSKREIPHSFVSFHWVSAGYFVWLPVVHEQQGASRGLVRQTMTTRCCPWKSIINRSVSASVSAQSYVALSDAHYFFRRPDSTAIQTVIPVGLVMALKPLGQCL